MGIQDRSRTAQLAGLVLLLGASLAPFSRAAANETYVVTGKTRTLSEIALFLYGHAAKYKDIAAWNQISPPYVIHIGEKLILKEAPSVSAKEGRQMMLASRGPEHHEATATPEISTDHETTTTQLLTAPDLTRLKSALDELREKTERELSPSKRDSEKQFELGEQEFKAQNYSQAAQFFNASRTLDSSRLAAWFMEYRCLVLSNQKDESTKVAHDLVNQNPELREIPILQKALAESERK